MTVEGGEAGSDSASAGGPVPAAGIAESVGFQDSSHRSGRAWAYLGLFLLGGLMVHGFAAFAGSLIPPRPVRIRVDHGRDDLAEAEKRRPLKAEDIVEVDVSELFKVPPPPQEPVAATGTVGRARGEEGKMGDPKVVGPKDNADPHLARQAALRDAREFGMIGLLNTGAGGDPNAPTAPWGRTDLGSDASGARGNMWGDEIGDAFGAGGLGLTGIGEGGGGRGEGIGLGNIGTLGHGSGTGTGQGYGMGRGGGGVSGPKSKPPSVRMGAVTVSGRLPPEVIQRIVRSNFGRFRRCYEDGLRSTPTLEGRVHIGFTITPSGSVSGVSSDNLKTTLANAAVVHCVEKTFETLSFPTPEGGSVKVGYPIIFAPGS